MNLIVNPGGALRGEVTLPGDKSLSHRGALFAALAEGRSRIGHFLVAGVTRSMLDALTDLGVAWSLDGATLTVQGVGLHGFHSPKAPIDCGHSGTTLRMLTGALAGAGTAAVLDGSPGLRRRPMARIVEPLRQMGVSIESAAGGRAPLTLGQRPPGRPLRELDYRLPVASAQVKTALLLAALAAGGQVTLVEPGPSRDHTERLLGGMGVEIERWRAPAGSQDVALTLQPPEDPLQPLNLDLPGDISSAAFLIVAALITPESEIVLRDVGLNPTRTGLLDTLREMGADIEIREEQDRHGEPVGTLVVRSCTLRGAFVDGPRVVRMIDEFPAFAVAAARADGPTEIRDAAELRHKESDRIRAIHQGLSALGAAVQELPDGLDLPGGGRFKGGTVRSFGDHRLAMALAVTGLVADSPVVVEHAEIISESFPGFVEMLKSLGARMRWARPIHEKE